METMQTAADLQRLYFRVNSRGTEASIPVSRYGVTFLLGKNGAGKTSLLNGRGKLIWSITGRHSKVSLITSSQSSLSENDRDEFRQTQDEIRLLVKQVRLNK
jgi:ABC-type branched-subunit amino acid transport system ATPase component